MTPPVVCNTGPLIALSLISCQDILCDERKGRKIARRVCGLETLGTAGLLVEAKRRGLIANISPLFGLLEEHSYWIAKPIVQWALHTAGE